MARAVHAVWLSYPLSQYIGDTEDEYTAAVTGIIWESEKTRYGDIYTMPNGMMVKGVYVRKDWCEELGIALDPAAGWTYNEYFDLVAKLTDAANGRYGSSYRGARRAGSLLGVHAGIYGGRDFQSAGADQHAL